MMHSLLSIPLMALLCLFLPHKHRLIILILLAIFCNIPFFNHLSLCDIIFSFSGGLSLFSLIFLTLFIIQSLSKHHIYFFTQRGIFFYILASLCVFLSFLGFMPFELYYLNPHYVLVGIFIFIIIMYFLDFILASLLAISLLGYGLSLFDYSNMLDYLFDAPIMIVFIILLLRQKFTWQK